MAKNYDELEAALPIRARVTFVLGIASRVLALEEFEWRITESCNNAIAKALQWQEGVGVSAKEIYDSFDPVHIYAATAKEANQRTALCAIVSALYYVAWHAYQLEFSGVPPFSRPVPEDIFEVSEEVIGEVCKYASTVVGYDLDWEDRLAARLFQEYRGNPGTLGLPVPRSFFETVE